MKTHQLKWLNRTEYPFESNFIDQQGTLQHYLDEGNGEPLVFVHGTPSWSFDFRNIIRPLKLHYRCIAIDHVGFGLSEKPSDYPYSLEQHICNLTNLINHLNLKNITLVLHDFGGPIGLEYALRNPNNIKRLVILNSWIGSSEREPEFQKLRKILRSPILPFLYLRLNFSPRFLLPSSFGENKPTSQIRRQFTAPFPTKKSRYGTLAFARSLLTDQPFFETQMNRISSLELKPTLFIWGMNDPFCNEKYLHKFQSCFRQAEVQKLAKVGHFPQEECPAVVAERLDQFMKKQTITN